MNRLFLCSYFAKVAPKFAKEFAKFGKRVCFIATAAKFEEINFYVDEAKQAFCKLGYFVDEFDIADLSCIKFDEILNKSDILYFSGGNTFYLLSQIYKNDLFASITSFLQHGGIYVGESAGAAIASPSVEYMSLMDKNNSNLKCLKALNFLPFYLLPHYKEEPFVDVCDEILLNFEGIKAINNDEFIVYRK